MAMRRVLALTVLGLIIVLSGCGGGAATEIDATMKGPRGRLRPARQSLSIFRMTAPLSTNGSS